MARKRKTLAEKQAEWENNSSDAVNIPQIDDTSDTSDTLNGGQHTPEEKPTAVAEETPQPEPPQTARKASKAKGKSPLLEALKPAAKEDTIRVSVDFPEPMFKRLQKLSKRLNQPKSEIIRRLVEQALDELDT